MAACQRCATSRWPRDEDAEHDEPCCVAVRCGTMKALIVSDRQSAHSLFEVAPVGSGTVSNGFLTSDRGFSLP